jgi:non-specific serine/threonine protein kinase
MRTRRARGISPSSSSLADSAASELWGAEQGAWVEKLGRERENLLSALAWCGGSGDRAVRGLRLVTKLQLYWLPSGMLELGYRLTTEALSRPAAQARYVERCGALYAASQLAYFLGQFRENSMHAEQSLAIAREIGDDSARVDALLMSGYGADELRDRGAALMHFEAALALARRMETGGACRTR